MKNGTVLCGGGRTNLFAKSLARQAPVAPMRLKREINRWRAPVTAEYLSALREADELVFQAILRGVPMRHHRALKN